MVLIIGPLWREKNPTNSTNSTLLYLRVRQEGKKRGPGNKVARQVSGIKLTYNSWITQVDERMKFLEIIL